MAPKQPKQSEKPKQSAAEKAAELARKEAAEAEAKARAAEEAAKAKAAAEAAEALERKVSLRAANQAAKRLDAAQLKELDSSLKKVTPFLKKVKERLGEETRSSLVTEARKLNLSKYVEEVAIGVAEAKLRITDVLAAAELSCTMHTLYASFAPALEPLLLKNATLLPPPPPKPGAGASATPPESDAERTARLSKKRSTLRLLFELLAVGVLSDVAAVLSCLAEVISEDVPPKGGKADAQAATATPLPNLPVLTSLAKHVASDPMILPPREGAGGAGEGGAEGGGVACVLAAAEQQQLTRHLASYFEAACASLKEGYRELRRVEKANQRTLLSKGELSDEATSTYDRCKKAHERLASGCATLGEALGLVVPTLEEEAEAAPAKTASVSVHGAGGEGLEDLNSAYHDAETRAFYEQLPDLKAVLPAVLFGEASKEASAGEAAEEAAEKKRALEALLKTLPQVDSKAATDDLASELVCKGAKLHRRLLVRALAQPPRRRPEALPRFARLAAILGACFRHVGSELVSVVLDDFEQARQAAKAGNAEDVAIAQHASIYVAELTKFRLVSAQQIFGVLKQLVEDFSPVHVQLTCTLLDGCGKFLYAARETQERLDGMLTLLSKLRSAHRLPFELVQLIDNAVYGCKPAEQPATVVDERPPIQRYIEALIFEELDKKSLERVVRQLRKLPWGDEPLVEAWVLSALLDCACVKYHSINLCACVVSALFRYHEGAMLRVVDAAVERARCAVDRNDYREGQRRVCLMRFLGELYNYKLLDSAMVFRVLLNVLPPDAGRWGNVVPLSHVAAHAELGGERPSARELQHPKEAMGDGPDDLARLRCVCALLDACGQYFSKGSGKRRLDAFLVYLCRYAFCKAMTPDVEFMLSDTLASLRPRMVRPATYAAASENVAQLEARLAADPKGGEGYAHELLHTTPEQRVAGGGVSEEAEGGGEEEEGGDEAAGEEDEEEEGDAGDEMDAELAEVERQLAELNAEEDGEGGGPDDDEEEALAYVPKRAHVVSQEEEDDFERMMQSMLSDAKKAAPKPPPAERDPLAGLTGVLKAKASGGPQGGMAAGGGGAARGDGEGTVALRVLRRGAKHNKLEADEVLVPVDDALAKTVIRNDEKANEERQRLKRQILTMAT